MKYAHQLECYDRVLELYEEDPRLAAQDAFRGGYINQAAQLFMQIRDYEMALMCAYILGDI